MLSTCQFLSFKKPRTLLFWTNMGDNPLRDNSLMLLKNFLDTGKNFI